MAAPPNGPAEPYFVFSHNNQNRAEKNENHLCLRTYLILEQFPQRSAIWKKHLSSPTKMHPCRISLLFFICRRLKTLGIAHFWGKKVKFKLAPQACSTFTTISKAHLILWPFFLEMRCCIPKAPTFSQDGPHMVQRDLTYLLHCPIFLVKRS